MESDTSDDKVMVTVLFYIQYIPLYHMVDTYVSKLECANQRYRSHLEQMVKAFPHLKVRSNFSKIIIIKIAYVARCTIYKRVKDKDVEKLRKDLQAGPRHYLGYPEMCDSSWYLTQSATCQFAEK